MEARLGLSRATVVELYIARIVVICISLYDLFDFVWFSSVIGRFFQTFICFNARSYSSRVYARTKDLQIFIIRGRK